jgi:crossover junction endodeoxyribonuclease RuvC
VQKYKILYCVERKANEKREGVITKKETMIYCGIDLSLTNTGFVVLLKDGKIFQKFLFSTGPSTQIEDRILEIAFNVLSRIDKNNYIVFLEGLSFGSRGQKMLELAGLHYYIRCQLQKDGINFTIIPPTTLKKYITGKGNCKKNLMLLKVYKKFGIEFDDDNIADAYSLARMALEGKK